jgi:hypothetical protein
MGNYNPRAPIILGEEWVPIRPDVVQFPTGDNVFEVGHGFTLLASRTLSDARFYVENPTLTLNAQLCHIYPAGTEDKSGPVQSVIIPVSAAQVTGAQITPSASATIVTNLANPSDTSYVAFQQTTPTPAATPQYLALFFATNSYAQQLNGKRILAVNLLYSGYEYNITTQGAIDTSVSSFATLLFLMNAQGSNATQFSELTGLPNIGPNGIYQQRVSRLRLGDYTELATSGPTLTPTEVLPWRYADLQRLEFTSATRTPLTVGFFAPNANDTVKLGYVALEVVYCTEQRVAVGGNFFTSYNLGANPVTLRSLNAVVNPVLAAGDYTITVSNGDSGNRNIDAAALTTVPPLSALRELYAIPPHPGVQVNLTQTVGDAFTKQTVHILPQLSVHVSGTGVTTEPHVYGDQVQAPVYGSITAAQTIYDDTVSPSASFPQVRFYARRFGQTTVPLTLSTTGATISGSSVFITPDAFDALPEIIDGWREVTLRFTTAPTMGGITPDPVWTWSAIGELAGNQWQVLGATAPSISGVPGNTLNLVRSIDQLGPATYQPSSGSAVSLSWLSPQVSAVAADSFSDAVLIFSQDPPSITGLGVAISTQAVTGFSECGSGPCCVPTAVAYHTITWPAPSGIEADQWDRTVSAGWGGAWSIVSGTAANWNSDGDHGTIITATSANYIATQPGTFADVDTSLVITLPTLNTAGFTQRLLLRYQDGTNYYAATLTTDSTGGLFLRIIKLVAGVTNNVSSLVRLPLNYAGGETMTIRAQFVGTVIRAKAWASTEVEPDWQVSAFAESTWASGLVGIFTSSSNTAMTMTYTQFIAQFAGLYGSAFELQRRDTLTDWQTIMLSTAANVLLFRDYEARVGVQSDYRVRTNNGLDFNGQWSSTVSSTLTAPGVTMPSCGTNKRGILIFTSNASQAGLYNLAYVPTWDEFPVEDFSFPEAGGVNITQQYGRDFQVGFHGTERGGEAFSRRLLIANAAVAVPRLAGVHSIRDMAWADLPYVCVRDDLGDRWFAAVIVGDDQVRRNRRLYNVDVSIVETTATAYPVVP